MLRRRILASAMASVMALGSVAVVANAEDTAAATTQVKTKADLEAYVKSFDSFRNSGINDYGSISGGKFIDAIEYAENVLADTKSTVDDFTVAYSMIEATYKALKIYTVEELKALIDTNKKNYESGNVYNEELGDPIFEETGFAKFEDAYEDAESVLGSSDSRIITDAYEELESKANSLSRYAVVTKAQFRTALKDYEAMLQKEFKYESWRVGTMGTDWVDLKSVKTETGYWGYSGQSVAYGELFAHLASANDDINAAYEEMDEIKTLKQTSLVDIVTGYYAAVNSVAVMNAWKADDTDRASKANVQKLLDEYHSRLVSDYNRTTANSLFDAVKSISGGDMKVLISINNGQATKWVDLKKAADKDEYDAYVANKGDAWYENEQEYAVNPDKDGDPIKVTKKISAELSVKSGVQFYIPLDANGEYWREIKDSNGNVVGYAELSTTKPEGKYKLITKNVEVNLADYIKVTSDMINYATDNADLNNILDGRDDLAWWCSEGLGQWGPVQLTTKYNKRDGVDNDDYHEDFRDYYVSSAGDVTPLRTDLQFAVGLAEFYFNTKKDALKDNNPIYSIDTTDSLAGDSAKGSSAEWAMVYRYLRYALHDKYDTSYDLYTKKDVEKLIEDCYELAELTGDAALFSIRHNRLVDARQYALDWVKAANKDKKYKDNVSAPELNGVPMTSTDVYGDLLGYYNELKKEYEAFKYSFEEVYLKIADTKSAIDEGELQATDSLLAALENTAYYLSTAESYEDEGIYIENDAFSTDRYFQGFNRVFTGAGDGFDIATSVTTEMKNGVEVEVVKTTNVPKADDSAVSKSHLNLKTAYEKLIEEVKAQTEKTTLLGDVNGDGVVNALDAAAILKAVAANTEIDVKVGDVNADGVVNALDAAAILKAATAQ